MSPTLKVAMALAVVYFAWGSSYIAIKLGVHDVAPWAFASVRFLLVAPLMLMLARYQRDRLPASRRDWLIVTATGLLMLVIASSLLAWAQQWVAASQAALIMATSALWMAWFGSWGRLGERVGRSTWAALVCGWGGVALLISNGLSLRSAPWFAYAGVVTSAIAWSAGSVFLRRYPPACGSTMTVAIQAAFAGVLMGAVALSTGHKAATWTPTAMAALAYLVLFGSVAGYSAYYWLVHKLSPAQLGTYAYVNPAVAVVLGYLILDERMSRPQAFGAVTILLSVIVVSLIDHHKRQR